MFLASQWCALVVLMDWGLDPSVCCGLGVWNWRFTEGYLLHGVLSTLMRGGGHVFGFGDVAGVYDLQPPISHNCFRLDQCNLDS